MSKKTYFFVITHVMFLHPTMNQKEKVVRETSNWENLCNLDYSNKSTNDTMYMYCVVYVVQWTLAGVKVNDYRSTTTARKHLSLEY